MKLRHDFLNIVGIFLVWKILLIIVLLYAINFVPLGYKDRFLGGGSSNYHLAPEVFAWANFDGEHYLSIAIIGYKGLEQAFFPVYPKTIGFFASPFYSDFFSALLLTTLVGLILSNLFLLLSLVILWDLVKLDYSRKIAYLTIILLLLFPTSFYFGSLYNESLFLFLTVSSFYAARKGNWWLAGILGGVASATRVFGILLFPSLIIEAWRKKENYRSFLWIGLVPLGLILYMYYQWIVFNDPIAFINIQPLVGEQRSSGFILLPQTFYRYLNMLTSVEIQNPIYQTVVLEFITGIIFLILPIYGWYKKMPLSYLFYTITGYFIASAQGSFSSTPRYVLVLFPSFIALAIFVNTMNKRIVALLLILLSLGLMIETTLFLRGYWVA